MRKVLAILALTLGLTACTDEEGTRNALDNMGFTNISIGGHAWYGCGDSDGSCTEFVATNPQGKKVHGVVGCGLTGCSKACIVRFK